MARSKLHASAAERQLAYRRRVYWQQPPTQKFLAGMAQGVHTDLACALQSGVCALQSGVCALQSGVCALQSGVCALQSGVCALQSGVCALQSGVCALQSGVCALQSGVCALQSGVCALPADLLGAHAGQTLQNLRDYIEYGSVEAARQAGRLPTEASEKGAASV